VFLRRQDCRALRREYLRQAARFSVRTPGLIQVYFRLAAGRRMAGVIRMSGVVSHARRDRMSGVIAMPGVFGAMRLALARARCAHSSMYMISCWPTCTTSPSSGCSAARASTARRSALVLLRFLDEAGIRLGDDLTMVRLMNLLSICRSLSGVSPDHEPAGLSSPLDDGLALGGQQDSPHGEAGIPDHGRRRNAGRRASACDWVLAEGSVHCSSRIAVVDVGGRPRCRVSARTPPSSTCRTGY